MQSRLQLSLRLSLNKFLDVAQVFIHEFTFKILTKRGEERHITNQDLYIDGLNNSEDTTIQ